MKIRNVKRIKIRLNNGRKMKTTYRRAYAMALQKPGSFTIIDNEKENSNE